MMTRIAVLALASFLQGDRLDEQVVAALDLKPGAVVANVGSGDSTELPSRILPVIGGAGKLVCEDIDARALGRLETKLKQNGAVEYVKGTADDPKLPARTFDAVLISRAYHEFTAPQAMLSHLRDALKPGGRLVVVESIANNRRNRPREEQIRGHDLSPEILQSELEAAGFQDAKVVILREGDKEIRYLVWARSP